MDTSRELECKRSERMSPQVPMMWLQDQVGEGYMHIGRMACQSWNRTKTVHVGYVGWWPNTGNKAQLQ